jgi:hypothetical protein
MAAAGPPEGKSGMGGTAGGEGDEGSAKRYRVGVPTGSQPARPRRTRQTGEVLGRMEIVVLAGLVDDPKQVKREGN